jgi:hypothetical protein
LTSSLFSCLDSSDCCIFVVIALNLTGLSVLTTDCAASCMIEFCGLLIPSDPFLSFSCFCCLNGVDSPKEVPY